MALRPQPGQAVSAANLRALLAGSAIVASHRDDDPRVQDAYSLRCTPQVHGAARDTVATPARSPSASSSRRSTTRWSCPTGGSSRAATSTARPVGSPATSSPIAVADVGAIAERRTDRLLDATRSHGLPPFLAPDAGVDSGLMIAQYTQAAMVAENRRLAAPASVDSLPTSAMQEDHVSMGWGAARKLRRVVDEPAPHPGRRARPAPAAALELRAPLAPAPGTAAALAARPRSVGRRRRARPLAGARARRRRGAARRSGAVARPRSRTTIGDAR